MSVERAADMFSRTRCDICGEEATLNIDHDHAHCPGWKTCGECVRGTLCTGCNQGIGMLRDDPDILRRAALYVEKAR
jgi:hypothetical protein